MKKSANFIILNAGESFKKEVPIATMKLSNGESIIDRQMRIISAKFPNAKFYHVLGQSAERALKHLGNVDYVINEDYLSTGTLVSTQSALEAFNVTSAYVVHGNIVFNETPFTNAPKTTTVFTCEKFDKAQLGVSSSNGKMTRMMWGLNPTWGEICYLDEKAIDFVKNIKDSYMKGAFLFEALNVYDREIRVSPLSSKVLSIYNSKRIDFANSVFEIQ
jgi:hypothetical protein